MHPQGQWSGWQQLGPLKAGGKEMRGWERPGAFPAAHFTALLPLPALPKAHISILVTAQNHLHVFSFRSLPICSVSLSQTNWMARMNHHGHRRVKEVTFKSTTLFLFSTREPGSVVFAYQVQRGWQQKQMPRNYLWLCIFSCFSLSLSHQRYGIQSSPLQSSQGGKGKGESIRGVGRRGDFSIPCLEVPPRTIIAWPPRPARRWLLRGKSDRTEL